MATVQETILYFFLFVGIYFQVFILFTYLLHRRDIEAEGSKSCEQADYPSVTVIIPVWNEEKTISKTIRSVFNLNYPKDKMQVLVVDDGSTDDTWKIMEGWKVKHPEITIYHKENGGKYTALNYGIERATTDLIGCLDADSFVDPDTLKKLTYAFLDPHTMAVTPAMKIHHPTTMVQFIQSTEYVFGILIKKVMSVLGAIHVTPGPFTIFRRSVFEKVGMFRHAHNTEDMEIAFRLQANNMKIENVHNAWVYTTGPNTLKKLYRQRLRWTHGFLENSRDYKYLYFNKKYGNLGYLTLPTGLTLIFGVLFSVYFLVYHFILTLFHKYQEWMTVGFLKPHFELNWFFVSTKAHVFLLVFVYVLMMAIIVHAQKLTGEKVGVSKSVILYFLVYPLISPFWVIKSIYSMVLSRKVSWR